VGRLLLMCIAAELSLPTADALSLQHACSRPLPHPIAHPCPSTHSTYPGPCIRDHHPRPGGAAVGACAAEPRPLPGPGV
jgi:hypothetical protein